MPARGPAIKRECQHTKVRHEHGDRRAYVQDGCRCDPCCAADVAYSRQLRKRQARLRWRDEALFVDATGTRRRIRALMAIGWGLRVMGAEVGMSKADLNNVLHYPTRIRVEKAQRVATMYDRLSMTRPEGVYADRARKAAAAKGWPPPLAWDDDEIDDPAAKPDNDTRCEIDGCGEKVQSRGLCDKHYRRWLRTGSTDDPGSPGGRYKRDVASEVHTAVRGLLRSGLSHAQIAVQVGTSKRTVARISAQMRDEAQAA